MSSIPENIIIRSLLKTATTEEWETLNKWLKEDEANIEYYFQLEKIWLSQNYVNTGTEANRWKMLEADIKALPHHKPVISLQKKIFLSLRYTAAMFIGAVLISSIWMMFLKEKEDEKAASVQYVAYNYSGVQNIVLPDRSEIWMNEKTRISYPEKFDNEQRVINLEGNAYFNIQKDSKKPFIVFFGDAEIEVTGTEFYVETAIDEEAFVTLVSGGINLKYRDTYQNIQSVSIIPGQQACLNISTGNIDIIHVDTYYYEAWKSGVYNFTNESLEKITEMLAKRLDLDIQLSPSLKMKRFTGRVASDENLDNFLTMITKVYPIKYRITGNKIEIDEL